MQMDRILNKALFPLSLHHANCKYIEGIYYILLQTRFLQKVL
jgi:hypothetical protein